MVKIAVCGAAGRMGSSILRLVQPDKDITVTGGVERPGLSCAPGLKVADRLSGLQDYDVAIDFTTVQATLEHLEDAVKAGKAIVVGTTGFSEQERTKISEAAKKIPVVFSPNMSIGINLLLKVVADVAKIIPNYDVEIVELHHNQKKDAPSGTAAKLAEVIASSLGRDMKDCGVYGREGLPGARKKEEIGVHAVRGGDIVGDHTVYFIGQGERIEITHRAHSRDTLAMGAIAAAKWLAGKKPGLYDMNDVLNLK